MIIVLFKHGKRCTKAPLAIVQLTLIGSRHIDLRVLIWRSRVKMAAVTGIGGMTATILAPSDRTKNIRESPIFTRPNDPVQCKSFADRIDAGSLTRSTTDASFHRPFKNDLMPIVIRPRSSIRRIVPLNTAWLCPTNQPRWRRKSSGRPSTQSCSLLNCEPSLPTCHWIRIRINTIINLAALVTCPQDRIISGLDSIRLVHWNRSFMQFPFSGYWL